MKVLHVRQLNCTVIRFSNLWIVHDNCNSVERSLVQQNFKSIGVLFFASWHVFPLSTLLIVLFFVFFLNAIVYPLSGKKLLK